MNTPYENLANAIVLLAVEDYREVTMWLNAHRPICEEDEKDADYICALADKQSIEQFFAGEWFCALTKLDGKALLKRLQCEVA